MLFGFLNDFIQLGISISNKLYIDKSMHACETYNTPPHHKINNLELIY